MGSDECRNQTAEMGEPVMRAILDYVVAYSGVKLKPPQSLDLYERVMDIVDRVAEEQLANALLGLS